jgi:hypothetical protein
MQNLQHGDQMMTNGKIRHNLKRRNKYNAQPTEVDGYRFDSKAEAKWFRYFQQEEKEGRVEEILRQTAFHLAPGVIYKMDFVVFYADGSVEAVEVKGFATPQWKMKKLLFEQKYPKWKLKVVK